MKINTLQDLMNGHETAEILSLMDRAVVRKLTVKGDTLVIDAITIGITETVEVPLNSEITYEPWVFDRGNLLFPCKEVPTGRGKLCTELDIIRYPDETEDRIEPAY